MTSLTFINPSHHSDTYFNNLIWNYNYIFKPDKLRKYFGVYGTVQDAVVMKDPVSRRSRGFGFITFTDVQAVDNALSYEPHTIDARKVSFQSNGSETILLGSSFQSLF